VPPSSSAWRTLGAARLTTFGAITSGRRRAASVTSCTTRSTSGRHTSPSRGTTATIMVLRPPNSRRIWWSICTKGWFAGMLASKSIETRRRPMPAASAAVTTPTAISTAQACPVRRRA